MARLGDHVGRHLVHRDAEADPLTDVLREQRAAACENWAIRALQAGAAIIAPPDVFRCVSMNEHPILPDTIGAGYSVMAEAIEQQIVATFGRFLNPRVPHSVSTETWNARKVELHNLTAAVFELCLEINGFTLSQNATDNMVCMEYECAANNREQAMYPNFTHAWLMFGQELTIQTVTGANISISRHHAGHQPHCGFIRRYVRDFHANQLDVINGIVNAPRLTTAGVTGCSGGFLSDGAPWATDEHSPPGKIASVRNG